MGRISRLARQFVTSLVVATGLLLALLALPQMANRAEMPVWREDLAAYLANEAHAGRGPAAILAINEATHPWDFDYRLDPATFDSYPSYALHYGYAPQIMQTAAMEHAPAYMYCVLLEKRLVPNGPITRQAVLVAGYDSLYMTQWVLHEGPSAPFPTSFRATLDTVGCTLPE
jgi:hypothetical protein